MRTDPLVIAFSIAGILTLTAGSLFLLGRIPVLFARRYLFSRRRKNAITIITLISVCGISLVTAALILILSVFNGFHSLIGNMFSRFDPALRVEPAVGKMIAEADAWAERAVKVEGVKTVCLTIENKALVKYFDRQQIVTVKGIAPNRGSIAPLADLVYQGEYAFKTEDGFEACVIGSGVAASLSASLHDYIHPVEIFAVSGKDNLIKEGEEALNQEVFFPSGFFSIQMEYDNKFLLVSYAAAEKLFDMKGMASALEIGLEPDADPRIVREKLEKELKGEFRVLSSYEQHKTLFDVMENEKFLGYLVVTLVLLLAAVNIVGSLSMIVIEKTKDIAVMRTFGTSASSITRIFLSIGFLIGLISAGSGSLLGLTIGLLQENFGIVKLSGGDSFMIDAYPLELSATDFLLVFVTVIFLSLLAAWYPARRAAAIRISEALRK